MACATAMASAVAPASLAHQQSRAMPAHQGLALAAPAKKPVAYLAAASTSRVVMSAAPQKQHNEAGLTALALLAAAVVPEMAEAVQPGVSPSLKNLLLSVVAGGVVLSAIGVAIAGVSTFDPVKRR